MDMMFSRNFVRDGRIFNQAYKKERKNERKERKEERRNKKLHDSLSSCQHFSTTNYHMAHLNSWNLTMINIKGVKGLSFVFVLF